MVETEKDQRRALLEGGVREAEREAFELLPEDERQCALCKTTCFMSALTIVNGREDQEIVCLRHFKSMEVDPANLILRYRFGGDRYVPRTRDFLYRSIPYLSAGSIPDP